MLHTALYRNGIGILISTLVRLWARYRRPFVASCAAVCIGLMVVPARAADEPKNEPPPPPKPPEIKGALVIVGGGGLPDAIRERFLELAGGKSGRLVVIPTASELADPSRIYERRSFEYWQTQGLASVSLLNTLDQKKANDPSYIKPLTEATAAWLGGGDQARLARAYRGTAVEKELHRLLERGGVIGGTSAGASVMSEVMITGGYLQPSVGQGFGLLPDVVIDQHFRNRKREKRLLNVLEKNRGCLGLGIDENTAVIVKGHKFKVLGQANVTICFPPMEHDQGRVTLLKANEEGDLIQLRGNVFSHLRTPAEAKPVASKTSRTTMP